MCRRRENSHEVWASATNFASVDRRLKELRLDFLENERERKKLVEGRARLRDRLARVERDLADAVEGTADKKRAKARANVEEGSK